MLAPFQSFLFNDGSLSAKGCVAALTRVRIQSCTFHVMFVFVSQVRKKRAIDARVSVNFKNVL